MGIKFQENAQAEIACPNCGPNTKLIVKTVHKTGRQFLGCPTWPDCNHTQGIPDEWIMKASGQKSLFELGD